MLVEDFAREVSGGSFGDLRLNKRSRMLAEALAKKPNMSIPAALGGKADIAGCYRFFNNEKVSPDQILQPHVEATYQRINAVDFVLLVQDTTEIDLTRPEQQVDGAGPMDCESRRGAFFHPTMAFDASGVPLGIVGQQSWTREEISSDSKAEKNKKRKQTPINEKESFRWLQGLQYAERTAAACPETTCVCVGDSEADIYDVFAAATTSEHGNLHLLVRAGQKRNTTDGQDWYDQVRETAMVAEQTITIRPQSQNRYRQVCQKSLSQGANSTD